MRKLFSERDFAVVPIAGRCSRFAPVATGASAIAADSVVICLGVGSIAPPIAAISRAAKDDWITATGKSGIAVATAQKA
jgi:hypothetical protein